jgi:ribosomal protein S18 acetylase RimI-like enzyme
MHKKSLSSYDQGARRQTGPATHDGPLVAQLGPGHRTLIEAHLLALTPGDRRLRFGHAISDQSISDYVRQIRFVRDAAFGAFDDAGQLVGFGHLAFGTEGAEFALSVVLAGRRRGIGRALLERASTHARNRGYDVLVMLYMSENNALASLARRAGMQIVSDPLECRAYIGLKPPTAHSVVFEAWREAVCALDLSFRLSAREAATSA